MNKTDIVKAYLKKGIMLKPEHLDLIDLLLKQYNQDIVYFERDKERTIILTSTILDALKLLYRFELISKPQLIGCLKQIDAKNYIIE